MTSKPTKARTPFSGTITAAVNDATSALRELGEECRESYDNMPENLQGGEYAQGLSDAADTLEYVDDIKFDDWFNDVNEKSPQLFTVHWIEDKRASPSRDTRKCNALAALQAAVEYLEEYADKLEEAGDAAEKRGDGEATDNARRNEEDVRAYLTDIQQIIDDAEGVEFPRRS